MLKNLACGLSSPVFVPAQPNWTWDYSGVTTDQLVGLTDEQLAQFDPLAVNLIVAKETPRLADLDIRRYQEQMNQWASDFLANALPYCSAVFQPDPELVGGRPLYEVGMISHWLDIVVGIRYKPEHEDNQVRYLNPSDLFLDGILDTLEGTCGNMAALNVAIAWRMGWPVSLACIGSHFLIRHDDGENVFNIETTCTGGGFVTGTDEQEITKCNILERALTCGSDLKALTPRERLGAFIGLRGRHFRDVFFETNDVAALHCAERDCLLARYLFPAHRYQNLQLFMLMALTGVERFEVRESGHPASYSSLAREVHDILWRKHECQERYQPPRRPGDSVVKQPRGLSADALQVLGSIQ